MERSGFFNSKIVDGAYDRLYNAKDYNRQLAAIVSNGVRRSGEDDLKVLSAGEMNYSVGIGRAWINGAWYHNDAKYSGVVPQANVTLPRIDRVILRYNEGDDVRSVSLAYLTGTPSLSPTAPELTRTETIWEIGIAEIYVGANVTSISQGNITDTRSNPDVCGWITTPVGYNDYFTSMDNSMLEHLGMIDEEWNGMKDKFASVTLFKKYESKVITDTVIDRIKVPVTQFTPGGVDILEVFVNGIYMFPGDDYTLEDDVVVFTMEKPVGTEITFSVYKSIDGTGLGSVSDEITELQNKVAALGDVSEYNYICTGVNDNWKISKICEDFFTRSNTEKQIKINVFGAMRLETPVLGEGSSSNRFKWFNVSPTGENEKRITLDFSHCSRILIPAAGGSYNIVFFGKHMTVIGARVYCTQRTENSAIQAFSSTDGDIKCYRSRFYFEMHTSSTIAENGLFEDCYGEVCAEVGESMCFNVNANGLLVVRGGEYRAYVRTGFGSSYGIKQGATGAALICYGVNFPQVTKDNGTGQTYEQTSAVNATAGTAIVRDTITQLTIKAGTVSSTIAANKPRG